MWVHKEGWKELATFGAGSYWGTEKFFAKDFADENPEAIFGTAVGFMSPDPYDFKDPTYNMVYSGNTKYI